MTPQGHSIKKFEAMAFGMSEEERIIDRILRFFFFFWTLIGNEVANFL
jgi:hypothetical protein